MNFPNTQLEHMYQFVKLNAEVKIFCSQWFLVGDCGNALHDICGVKLVTRLLLLVARVARDLGIVEKSLGRLGDDEYRHTSAAAAIPF